MCSPRYFEIDANSNICDQNEQRIETITTAKASIFIIFAIFLLSSGRGITFELADCVLLELEAVELVVCLLLSYLSTFG